MSGNEKKRIKASDVAAAKVLIKLMKRRGAEPPKWATDLAQQKASRR